MRNGVFVPAAVVRAVVALLAAATAAALVVKAPAMWRYARIRAM